MRRPTERYREEVPLPMPWGRLALATAAACLLTTACAGGRLRLGGARDGEVVEAEGWAVLEPGDLLGSKQRSLAEAQKKAVEKVLGVYISAKTRVSEAVTVNQNILGKVDGYVKKYDVLWDRPEEGYYKTRIRAHVLYRKVGEDLKRLGLLKPPAPPGNPRVAIVVAEEGGQGRAAAAARRGFLERGFYVVDGGGEAPVERSTATAAVGRAGRRLGADLVVRGEAAVHPLKDVRLGGFHSYRARVSLEALKSATGEVVARQTQEASGLDPSPDIAAGKALESAGQLAAEALAARLASELREQINVVLRVEGVAGLDKVQRLAEDLRLQPDVSSVALSQYLPGGAEYVVTTEDMPGDKLVALLLTMKRYAFSPRAVTPYLVEVGLAP